MTRMILHIGIQRTGTTALQEFLECNSGLLGNQGFHYYERESEFSGVLKSRNGFFLVEYGVMQVKPEARSEDRTAEVEKDLEKFAREAELFDTFVMTDENFWREGALYPGFWQALHDYLTGIGFDEIDLVVYLRRQDEYVSSLWNQRIKSSYMYYGSDCPQFADMRKTKRLMNFDARLAEIESIYGKEHVLVRVYDRKKLEGGDIRQDFCKTIGVEITDDFEFPKAQNSSIKGNVVEIKRYVNSVDSYRETKNYLVGAALRTAAQEEVKSQPYSPLSPDERRQIIEHYEAGNARIARDYLGIEDGVLFDVPETFPEKWTYDPETFDRDMARFFADGLSREHLSSLELRKNLHNARVRLAKSETRLSVVAGRLQDSRKRLRAAERKIAALEKREAQIAEREKKLEEQEKKLEEQEKKLSARISKLEELEKQRKARENAKVSKRVGRTFKKMRKRFKR